MEKKIGLALVWDLWRVGVGVGEGLRDLCRFGKVRRFWIKGFRGY